MRISERGMRFWAFYGDVEFRPMISDLIFCFAVAVFFFRGGIAARHGVRLRVADEYFFSALPRRHNSRVCDEWLWIILRCLFVNKFNARAKIALKRPSSIYSFENNS